MVRVAAFRARALAFFPRASAGLSTSTPDLDYLAHTGKELEDDLVDWAESMSGEYSNYKEPTSPDNHSDLNSHGSHRNRYTTYGHASLWIRQRALRLIINSIFIKFILVRMQTSTDHEHLIWKQARMKGNLESISRELCADMSYFFKVPQSRGGETLIPALMASEGNHAILPSLAPMLAWPLAVAVSTENVPEPQRKWLQGKLGSVADSLGDAVLHDVRRRDAFVF
jgi:hypothetical protein